MTIEEHSIYIYIISIITQQAYMSLDSRGIRKYNRVLKKNFSV